MNQPQPATQPLDLDAIQARADAATDGPWTVDDSEIEADIIAASGWIARTDSEFSEDRANAEFIAAARTDVEQLLARVRELEAETERLRDVLKRTRALAETDPPTCADCGHLESAHDPAGDRDCNASAARVRSCTCAYYIACYPQPAPSGPQTAA
ncbi:hypothetical protein ACH4E7_06980 [Kitasatospora sp. NPDC018058]|uniref:hypothetical protein n=1 Tax=Kitasatospora sp. NPDC018058 TaxID=3364025 RepID=UPI0037C0E455